MTPAEFAALPALLRARQVYAVGIPPEVLQAVALEVLTADQPLPAGAIGYVRPPSARSRQARRLYRKDDIARAYLGKAYAS